MVKERKATIKSLYCDKCGTEIPEKNRKIYPIERYIYVSEMFVSNNIL